MTEWTELELVVNGKCHRALVQPHWTLVKVLREVLGYTGTKEVCGMGVCGACTVLVDGKPISSCIELATRTTGRTIETVEGLASGGSLHPLQKAFLEKGGFQCGFCTPGVLMSAKALLNENESPSLDEIKEYMGGSQCRCTGYLQIIEAIIHASKSMGKHRSALTADAGFKGDSP